MKGAFVSVVVVAVFLVAGAVSPALSAKTISGTISTNTVLDTVGGRVYQVTGFITVNAGVTLTIDPGVVLKFNAFTGLTVNGKLVASGGASADSLIYFTSIRDDNAPAPTGEDTNGDGNATTPSNQNWYYIHFTAGSDDTSILKHCVVRFGGYPSTGMIVCDNASPTLEDCELSAAFYGVRCNAVSNPVIRDTSINAMTDVPIAIDIQADPVFDNLAFGSAQDNGFDALGLLGGTLTGANTLRIRGATLGATPIPNLVYILLSTVTVAPGGLLTIDPGVVVKPRAGVEVQVQGTLSMDGTVNPDSQIVFTSFKDDNFGTPNDTNNDGSITSPARGDWGQIEFLAGSTGSVTYATIKFGGNGSEGMIRCANASPVIGGCLVSDTYYGIEQRGTASSIIASTTISNCLYTPILMSVSANPSLLGLTFTNNTLTALGLISETIGTNSLLKVRSVAGYDNITYWQPGTITMSVGANLRIEPGVVIKRAFYTSMVVDGSLRADGTVDSMIVFTSQYDDAHGNPPDTENNGTATVPAAGQSGYIKFSATSDDTKCILDYCVVSYGGYDCCDGYRGAVWCNSSAPTITNCQFRTNSTGIRTDGNANPTIADNDFFNTLYIPLATSVVADPQYSGNTFNQNNYHAVGILAETLSQNATLERIFVGGPPQFPEYFPYLHLGTLTIASGSKLTIEPGVIVKVLGGGGPITVNGGLDILGVNHPDSLVVYTSISDDSKGGDSNVDGSTTSPAAGNWGGIQFNSTATASLIEHALFRFGGSSHVIRLSSASPTIRDCEFEINTWGLWIQNVSNPIVQDNLFRLTTYVPISASAGANPTFSNITYDNNGFDALGLIGEAIGQDVTISPYNLAGYTNITRIMVGGNLSVGFGATLTFDPGIVLKMGRIFYEPFGSSILVDGAIDVNGTALSPVVFTSVADDAYGNPLDTNNDGALSLPAAGQWASVEFRDVSDDAENILTNCIFRYGGYSGYGVRLITASPTFQNCVFERNNVYGMRIEGSSTPTINGCTFDYHTSTPVLMSLISDPNFTGVNQFNTTNGYRAIGIIGETLAQDVLWERRSVSGSDNIPYILTASLTAGLSSILRIEPGVVIKPLPGVILTVKRGLIAEGKASPDSLIVFTSPRDDFYGGDTNNDSTLTDGSSYRWGRIQVDNEAIDDSTRFSYCVFRYAENGNTNGAVNVTSAHPEFSRCIFSNNGIGINFNGAAGDSTKGKIERCDIFDNTYYGVKNSGLSFVVSAKNSWWGHASGPYDPSDDTGSGGFYNPTGQGDPVTNQVDYSGWKTGGVQNLLLGDVSLNGEVRAFDASLVLQHLALLITLSAQQQTVGDVNCSGSLSTLDASYILRHVAGILSYFPCAGNAPVSQEPDDETEPLYLPGSTPGAFEVRIPAFVLEEDRETVVPIAVSGNGELLGHEYHLSFDPDVMTVADVRLTADAEGAMLFWRADDDGGLHIAAASMDLLPVTAAVEIVLRAAGALSDGARVELDFTRVRLNEQDLTLAARSEGGTARSSQKLPQRFELMQNHPNPFNPSTTIPYAIPVSSGSVRVTVVVYDVAGRLVRALVDRVDAPGLYAVPWDGRDERGAPVGSGVYFYRIDAGGFQASRKMVLLK